MEISAIRSTPAFSASAKAAPAENNDGPAYGAQQVGIQNYLPIRSKRKLSPEEKEEVTRNLDNWLPTIFPGYGTPVPHLLASPTKVGTLTGVTTGGIVGGAAALIHGLVMHDFSGTTAAIAAAAGGLTALATGVLGYFRRDQENNNLVDLLKRLPEGATQRDLMSDPVYQQDQQFARTFALQGGSGVGNAAITAGILGAFLRPRD